MSRLSLEFPKVTFSEWRNNRMHYISVAECDPTMIPSIRRRLRAILSSDKGAMTGDKLLPERGLTTPPALVLRCFSRQDSIAKIFDRNTAVPLYPIVYRVGWEYYRTLVLDRTRSPHLIQEFSERGKVEVIRTASARADRPAESIAIQLDELTASMTDLQVEAVVRSVSGGYFDVPRKARLGEIAGRTGVPRRTFGEHLQKAEGKLLRGLTPYLALIRPPERSSASGPGGPNPPPVAGAGRAPRSSRPTGGRTGAKVRTRKAPAARRGP